MRRERGIWREIDMERYRGREGERRERGRWRERDMERETQKKRERRRDRERVKKKDI